MPIKTKEQKYYGILAAMDWNSRQWQAPATEDDLTNSLFGFVVDNGITYTSLNFAHELSGLGKEEYYSGLVPHFYKKTPDPKKFKDVQIVFLRSRDWDKGKTYIVGFYAFPSIVRSQKTVINGNSEVILKTNIQALVKDIHLLD